jgi:hypothetical protein
MNACLHRGPKFEQRILDILLQFQTYPVALTADIEKAFLTVSISEEDRGSMTLQTTQSPEIYQGSVCMGCLLALPSQCYVAVSPEAILHLPPRVDQTTHPIDICGVSGARRLESGELKILGVRWDISGNRRHFGFDDITHLATELEPTKRNPVSIVGAPLTHCYQVQNTLPRVVHQEARMG